MYFITPILIVFIVYDSNLFRNALLNSVHKSNNVAMREKLSQYCISYILEKRTFQRLRLSSEIDYSVEKKSTGHAHSDESKAKISAANKGKVPWNLGRQHSEETKRRIAEATKESYMKKKLAEAKNLGLSIEQMEKSKKVKNQFFNFLLRIQISKWIGSKSPEEKFNLERWSDRRWAKTNSWKCQEKVGRPFLQGLVLQEDER